MRLKKMLKNQKGFSLIELMIVVAIIGVLATMAVPKFKVFQARAKRSEASSTLHHIYTLEEAYQLNFNMYQNFARYGSLAAAAAPNCVLDAGAMALGFSINPCTNNSPRYGYSVINATAAVFTATAATGTNLFNKVLPACATADLLTVNNMNRIIQTQANDAIFQCIQAN